MQRNISSQRFGVQILVLLGCIFIGLIFLIIASVFILSLHFKNVSLESFGNLDFTNPNNLSVLKSILPIQTIFLFGVPAILFGIFAYKKPMQYLGFRSPIKPIHFLIALLIIICSMYFVGLLAQWNKALPMPQSWLDAENQAAVLTKELLTMNNFKELIESLIMIALLPAICEELLFRGCMQNIILDAMPKNKAWVAIIITGIIFALIHGQMQTLFPRIFLGCALGFIYYFSNSLWVSIFAHFLNNGMQVVITYLAFKKIIDPAFADDITVTTFAGLASGAISFALIYFLFKSKKQFIIYK